MKKTGFGFLRLPRLDAADEKSVDYDLLNRMVDSFLEKGGQYFDTAYTYLDGISEEAIRKSLTERHPRNRFLLADKLPGYDVTSYEQCREFFEESLARCGVDYFDVYMLHWLNRENYVLAEQYEEFRFLQELKAAGKATRIGFSYHDSPELLDEILKAHPEVDLVQLQINYLDWDSPSIQAQACYETAVRHGKRVIIMEPVKGGTLAALPTEAETLLRDFDPSLSPARLAMRFAHSLPAAEIVLSGMNTLKQIEENLEPMPQLSPQEEHLCADAAALIRSCTAIACTSCGYCTGSCPKQIAIPDYFRLYNDCAREPGEDWKITPVYQGLALRSGKASDCISCRQCEQHCPQGIEITKWLKKTAEVFEG